MAKLLDLSNEGMGDISDILHNQGVSDLSWLAVDEEEYRKFEALPKQNLDFIPELQKALVREEDDDVPHLIPLRPHALVNTNPLYAPKAPVKDMSTPIRNRVARLVMAGTPSREIGEKLQLEFTRDEIQAAATTIKEILNERGLLGNVYVDASHFPLASRDPREKKLAQTLSKNASFVIGGCGGSNGCDCHQSGFCKTFGGKRVVSEVPYGPKLASVYSSKLADEKRPLDGRLASAKSREDWKSLIQSAFLKPAIHNNPDGVKTIQHRTQVEKLKISPEDVKGFWDRRLKEFNTDPTPSPSYMKYAKRMALGIDDRDLLNASLDPELSQLACEFGLLGHSWLDMDALGGCKATLKLIESKGLLPDFVLRRAPHCDQCKDLEDGACACIAENSNLVHSKPEIGKQSFVASAKRAMTQGRVSASQIHSMVKDGGDWSELTRQINLLTKTVKTDHKYSGSKVSAYYGTRISESGEHEIDLEKARRTISHLMNIGFQGPALANAILEAYPREDLKQIREVGLQAATNDGIQGVYFIDPTAYRDYGKGCEDGSKTLRKRGAPNLLVSSKCAGCMLQTAPGWCSKYAKDMIRSIPDQVRAQAAASKRQLPVIQEVNVDPSDQFQLSPEINVDLNGGKSKKLDIALDSPTFF